MALSASAPSFAASASTAAMFPALASLLNADRSAPIAVRSAAPPPSRHAIASAAGSGLGVVATTGAALWLAGALWVAGALGLLPAEQAAMPAPAITAAATKTVILKLVYSPSGSSSSSDRSSGTLSSAG